MDPRLSTEETRQRWQGVVIPLVTPFADGRPDLAALRRNVAWLLERGARQGNSLFIAAGSGGDFPMMNLEERQAVIRAIAEATEGLVPIIAAAQSLDLRDSVAICRLAEELELDAVQISGPFYYDGRPGDAEAWLTEVASQTSAGFAVYNNWYTGYDMPLDLVERLLDLPNAVGVKWASPNVDVFTEGVHRFAPRMPVINNTLASVFGHMLGARPFVSHWPNFYPEFCWALWDLMEAGRYGEAQRYFEGVMRPYRRVVGQVAARTAGEGVFVRPFMEAVGLTAGRSPLPSRDAAVTPELRREMEDALRNARELTDAIAAPAVPG